MYIECENCEYRDKEICTLTGAYAEQNHIYTIEHCTERTKLCSFYYQKKK